MNWTQQPDNEDITSYQSANPTTIYMPTTVHIGLALTSHAPAAVTTAIFSDVQTVGYVGGLWQIAAIGTDHPGNSPDDLCVVVEDGAGAAATVVHPAPTAVNVTTWTPWRIDIDDVLVLKQ